MGLLSCCFSAREAAVPAAAAEPAAEPAAPLPPAPAPAPHVPAPAPSQQQLPALTPSQSVRDGSAPPSASLTATSARLASTATPAPSQPATSGRLSTAQPQHHKHIPPISESDLQRVADLLSRFSLQAEGCTPSNIIPKAMHHLCANLPAAWACLTGISSSGQHFQMLGAAHWHNEHKLCTAHPMFLACLGRNQAGDRQHTGLKWTSSMQEFMSTPAPVEMCAGDVTPITSAPSLKAMLVRPTGQPLLSTLAEDASDLHLMHSDWQKLVRRAALRCVVNIPIESAMDVGRPDGCLTLGFQEPVDWDEQWWFRGVGLLRGWLAGLLTQQLKLRDLDLAEAVLAAPDLSSLARCFVHQLPEVVRRVHGATAEVRLAVVSSRMVRARVYIDDSVSVASAAAAAMVQSGQTMNLRKGPLREARKGRLAESSGVAVPGPASAPMVATASPLTGRRGSEPRAPESSTAEGVPPAAGAGTSPLQASASPGSTAAPTTSPAMILGAGISSRGLPSASPVVSKVPTTSAPIRRGGIHDSSWSTNRVGDSSTGNTLHPQSPPTQTSSTAPGPSAYNLNDTSNLDELSAKAAAGPAPVLPPGRRRPSVYDASQRLSPWRPSVRTSTYAGLMQIGGADDHVDHVSSNEPLHRALQRRSVTSRVISTTALWEQEPEESAGEDAGPATPAPVRDVDILTDGTLLANALEAGDVMHIRNMAVFMDRRRMMPHDIGLGGEHSQLGSLFLLPLISRGRALGGVYVMLRFAPGLDIPMSYWSDLREQMSAMVFRKLSGDLRSEWCGLFVDEATMLPSVPRPLQLAMLAAWAESAKEGLSTPGSATPPASLNASAGGVSAAGATSPPFASSSARQPSATVSPPAATSATSLPSSSFRASLAALQRASVSNSAGGLHPLPGLSTALSNASLDYRNTNWSTGLPPPNTPLHILNSADLPNSPGSRALADLLPKTPHHLAISRVLKLMKLHEPYVNRKDRKKRDSANVEAVKHEHADSEPLLDLIASPSTRLAQQHLQVRRSSAPSCLSQSHNLNTGSPTSPPPPSPSTPGTPHASEPLKRLNPNNLQIPHSNTTVATVPPPLGPSSSLGPPLVPPPSIRSIRGGSPDASLSPTALRRISLDSQRPAAPPGSPMGADPGAEPQPVRPAQPASRTPPAVFPTPGPLGAAQPTAYPAQPTLQSFVLRANSSSNSGRRSVELVAEQLQRAGLAILQPSNSAPIRAPILMPGVTQSDHQLADHLGAIAIMEADPDDVVLSSTDNIIVAESGSVFVSKSNALGAAGGSNDGLGHGSNLVHSLFPGPPQLQQQQQPALATVAEAEAETSSRMALLQANGVDAGAAPDFAPLPKDLQFWPELVDLQQRIAAKPQKSVYQGWFQGQTVVLKLLRYGRSMDRHSLPTPRHVELLHRLATIQHPSLLRLMLVYPLVFEPVNPNGAALERVMGVPPLVGKHRLGLALLLEHIPSCITLKQAMQRQMTFCFAPPGYRPPAVPSALGRASLPPAWRFNSNNGSYKSSARSSLHDRRRPQKSSSRSSVRSTSSFNMRSPVRSVRVSRNISFNAPSMSQASPVVSLTGGPLAGLGTQRSLGSPQTSRTLPGTTLLRPVVYARSPAHSRQLHVLTSPAASRQLPTLSPSNSRQLALLGPYPSNVGTPFGSTAPQRRLRTPEHSSTLRTLLLSQIGQDYFASRLALQAHEDESQSDIRNLMGTERTTPQEPCSSDTQTGPRVLVPNFSVLVSILMQVASAVAALHRAGLLHGELRTENILLSSPAPASSSNESGRLLVAAPTLRHSQLSLLSVVEVGRASVEMERGQPVSGTDTAVTQQDGNYGHGMLPGPSGTPRRSSAVALTAAAAITGGAFSSAGSASGTNARPSPSTPPNLAPGSLTPEVQVKLKDAAMCTLSNVMGGQVSVRKMVGRRRMAVLHHLPPEVLQGQRPRRSTDVYAFGVLMWELVTGLPASRRQAEAWAHCEVPAWYRNLAERCWAVRPKQRPSFIRILSALGTQSELEACSDHSNNSAE